MKFLKEQFKNNKKLLWKNPNPEVEFEEQQIHLNSADYDFLEIYFIRMLANPAIICFKTTKSSNIMGFVANGFGKDFFSRVLKHINDTTFQCDTCYYVDENRNRLIKSDYLVPLYIIGIKEKIEGLN